MYKINIHSYVWIESTRLSTSIKIVNATTTKVKKSKKIYKQTTPPLNNTILIPISTQINSTTAAATAIKKLYLSNNLVREKKE